MVVRIVKCSLGQVTLLYTLRHLLTREPRNNQILDRNSAANGMDRLLLITESYRVTKTQVVVRVYDNVISILYNTVCSDCSNKLVTQFGEFLQKENLPVGIER